MFEQERDLTVRNRCGRTFHSEQELQRHQREEHSSE